MHDEVPLISREIPMKAGGSAVEGFIAYGFKFV